MRKTKLLLLLLVFAMILSSFVACKPEDENDNNQNPPVECDHVDLNEDGICEICQNEIPVTCETHKDATLDGLCDLCGTAYDTISVTDAMAICGDTPNEPTEERYYILATVKTVSNVAYGEMYIQDDKGGELYVYGTYTYDGVDRLTALESQPQRGDTVVLHCTLQNYNGTKQVKNARLVGFKHVEADISEYEQMSIADARAKEEGALIILEGVVAQITYANGYKPSGVMLVDATGSIYVYGADVAGNAKVGNKIKVAGVKDFWILDTETSSASKFGYKGCNQLSDAMILENDKGNHEFDKTSVEETTVKAIMDTPVTEDITSKIFKVNALIKRVDGTGFTNYYINDIDGYTGSYVYTQCNGGDFDWLDKFNGKICTVYVTALNAKSNPAGCLWRFLPIAVIDEGYTFDLSNTAKFVVEYHTLNQFLSNYAWNPAYSPSFNVVTNVSSELLGFENATVTYTSSDDSILTFITNDGVTKMQLVGFGEATVTITATYGETSHSETVTITSTEAANIPAITVAEAIAASKGDEIIVKGIVGPSLVNKVGFYLIDESGVIAVTGPETIFEGLAIGNEIILKGKRNVNVKDTTTHAIGQTYISDVEILANDYAIHDYSTATFVEGKDVTHIYNLDPLVDYTTTVFVVTAKVTVVESGYSSNIYLEAADGTQLRLYSSSSGQYSWLKAFAGQTVTVEVAACNWNDKSYYTGCALAVVNSDGTKTYNTLNFK